jgi:sugar O-acyltransferase (sialic acid O-acetyltransferase NeuD family)
MLQVPAVRRSEVTVGRRAPKKILVYGSREFGQVVRDLAVQCGYAFAGFIDDVNSGDGVLGKWSEVARNHGSSSHAVAMAIGYRHLRERRELCARVRSQGYATPALVHPRAYVRDAAAIGEGAFIMAGAVVDVGASVGAFAVVWPGATVNHHSRVGANTFISPNVAVCGHSAVGEDCFIGAGATIVDHESVPAGSFVKAGSVYAGPG